MVKFADSKSRTRGPKRSFSRGGSRGGSRDRRGSEDRPRGGRSDSRDRGALEMTQVICSDCGKECEVPFKPTSSKPVYCRDCFSKEDRGGSDRSSRSSGRSSRPPMDHSNKDLDMINEKLNKIMKALKIE